MHMQVLMTEEWTGTVARAARWGWWGFNTDRVKRLQKMIRDEGRTAGGSAAMLSVDVEAVGGSVNLDSPRLSARGTKQVGVRACARACACACACARARVWVGVHELTACGRAARNSPTTPSSSAAQASPRSRARRAGRRFRGKTKSRRSARCRARSSWRKATSGREHQGRPAICRPWLWPSHSATVCVMPPMTSDGPR